MGFEVAVIYGSGSAKQTTQALQMILLGSPISEAEANLAGLVAQLFELGRVLENVVQTASRLAGLSPAALSLAKEAVCSSDDLGCITSWSGACIASLSERGIKTKE
ncbi:hypothetical protein B0J13DRAFT_518907 [Dactylonectria estremocensis]|uniref:Uncharacterized protein n=1 Tax=Dactylonectria estremocensis TaxID=1079267 RepID=A0A9P9JF98_9HYPO|nr:hypothetical protein B0J13DRAFT_518907 [Dactylonectria estremocensis]